MRPPRYTAEWLAGLDRATVTTREAARVLGSTPRSVIARVQAGDLDGFRLGGRYYIVRASLLRMVSPP